MPYRWRSCLQCDSVRCFTIPCVIQGFAFLAWTGCHARAFILAVSLGIALLGSACGDDPAPASDDLVAALAAAGPYAVGYRPIEVTYADPLSGAARTLSVLVWYPATPPATGAVQRPFYLLKTSDRAVVDAPVAALGPRPVAVFSHGHQAYAAAASYLMEHLASHGWLVVAPNHRGNTLTDGDRSTQIYYQRVLDLNETARALAEWPADDPLASAVSDEWAVLGHSFGGYSAYAAAGAQYDVDTLDAQCASDDGPREVCSTYDTAIAGLLRSGLGDERWSAVVSLDPGNFDLFGAAGVARVGVPSLHGVAEGPNEPVRGVAMDRYWAALRHPRDVRLALTEGAHNDFVDACRAGVDVRCSDLPADEIQRSVKVYVLAFLRATVVNDASVEPVLSGRLSVSDLVTVAGR